MGYGIADLNKPALIFLCQRIPYPPNKGEKIITYNYVQHLRKHYRIFLGTFIDDPADWAGVAVLQGLVEEMHVDSIHKPWAYFNSIPRWLLGEPVSFALFRSSGLEAWVKRIGGEQNPVAIVAVSSNISQYAIELLEANRGLRPRTIFHYVDVDSEKFAAYAAKAGGLLKWIYGVEARRVRREEIRMAGYADVVTLVTDEEAALFKSILPGDGCKIDTLSNGVDVGYFDPGNPHPVSFEGHGATYIFSGNMDYPPNVDAVKWFSSAVFPLIKQRLPQALLLIVGANPTEEVMALAGDPAIMVTGRVQSVAAYMAKAQVAVAPLRIARGIQNKVLEAMAMSLPVVVSSGALTGIAAEPDKHLLLAHSPEEWAAACVGLVENPDKADRLGAEARKLILQSYTWDAQYLKLDRLLTAP